jgi:hypothetical protein
VRDLLRKGEEVHSGDEFSAGEEGKLWIPGKRSQSSLVEEDGRDARR